MRILSNIQIKALLLLTVFSLSTIAGFACSVGIDLGYNKHHHAANLQHEHDTHHKSESVTNAHHQHATEHKSTPSEKDCCADSVIKITQTDKRTTPSENSLQPPVFSLSYLSFIQYYLPSVTRKDEAKSYKYPDRKTFIYPDIRIALQSFQI